MSIYFQYTANANATIEGSDKTLSLGISGGIKANDDGSGISYMDIKLESSYANSEQYTLYAYCEKSSLKMGFFSLFNLDIIEKYRVI